MSFFAKISRLFRGKKKPSGNHREKIQALFSHPEKIQNLIAGQIDILLSENIQGILKLPLPDTETINPAFHKIRFPEGDLPNPENWSHLRVNDLLSSESREALITALLEPGPRPKLEVYKNILGQPAIGEMIARQLQGIVLAVNEKLNPFSQVLKSSKWEDQMYKIIQSFVPGMQNSLAEKLARDESDPEFQVIFRKSIEEVLNLSSQDFHFPAPDILAGSQEKWISFYRSLIQDPILWASLTKHGKELLDALPESWKNQPIKELIFASSQDYKAFLGELSQPLTNWILATNKQTNVIERSMILWMDALD